MVQNIINNLKRNNMKNIHILPTDKPSRLILQTNGKLRLSEITFKGQIASGVTQNICITSDEEIENCWFINLTNNEIGYIKNNIGIQKNAKKIILTTDQDLIKDGVQAIDDEFLEWFVKNPSCEEVEVKKTFNKSVWDFKEKSDKLEYKIIISKEEPNYNMKKEILIEMMNQDEELGLYEETVEEYFLSSIKNMLQFNNDALAIRFMEKYYHAKKEQERSYSEEEVIELLASYAEWSINGDCLYYEWFEQFKKK
jgi:hypothetical protein